MTNEQIIAAYEHTKLTKAQAFRIKAIFDTIMDSFWNNDQTPEGMLAALGSAEVTKQMLAGIALKQAVATFDPSIVMQEAPADFVIENDLLVGFTYRLTVNGPVGASVTVGGTTQTITNGSTVFTGLPAGEYVVASSLDGYQDTPVTVSVSRHTSIESGLTFIPVIEEPVNEEEPANV